MDAQGDTQIARQQCTMDARRKIALLNSFKFISGLLYFTLFRSYQFDNQKSLQNILFCNMFKYLGVCSCRLFPFVKKWGYDNLTALNTVLVSLNSTTKLLLTILCLRNKEHVAYANFTFPARKSFLSHSS